MAKFAAKDSNKNITLSPHGTGKVVVGTGATDATVQSDGNHNLILQTGNSTTGSISITDGADGNIAISPNGTGTVVVNTDLDVDNININGNAITSTDTDGNIDLTPNGTGEVNISKVDIDSGAVDGITLGTNSAVTEAQIDNINLNGNTITSTNTDGNIDLTPNGTGEVNISKVDIDSGTIDGVTIGGSSAGAITATTINGTTITGTSFATTGDMAFGDNDKAIYGAGNDLQIYHDGSNSIINDSGTGNLIIGGDNDVTIADSSNTETKAVFTTNGAANLYYDNSNKFQTTATGVNVNGNVAVDSGNVVIETSGNGIDFDGNSRTAVFDDYEEGSLSGSFTNGTYSGNYTKIGRQVTLNFRVTTNSSHTGTIPNIALAPFANMSANYAVGCGWGVANPYNHEFLAIFIEPSTTTVNFVSNSGGSGITVTGSGDIRFAISYFN